MLNINEEDLKLAIVAQAVDQILTNDSDLSALISIEVKKRLDKIFADRAETQIQKTIDEAIDKAFDAEYQRVNSYGEQVGEKTTIKSQLEKIVNGYWSTKVEAKTGKPATSDYNTVTRAEYTMTIICAEDFSAKMKSNAANITGALKDGLRGHMGAVMDNILNDLFHVKSLQDQGIVKKPY